MKKENTLFDRIRYQFDNTLSKGTIALIGWLALISLVIILLAGLIVSLVGIAPAGQERLSFGEAAWLSLMRTLDAGTMGGDEGWGFRLAMFAVTLGGVFIISTLIGVLTSGLESKIDELRKGRTRVIESNHTVILGWSEQIYTIISELVVANENQKDACIVILGEVDKIEMQDAIRERIPELKTTRVVCRTGSAIEPNDLALTSLNTSKSIVILSPDIDDPDAEVIKTVLAITNNPSRRTLPFHIVAEIRDEKNLDIARLVGKDEVEYILVSTLVARIIAQTCRQSGLSVVYTELLDFGGDEMYFNQEPALVGETYRNALSHYRDSTVIGVVDPEKGPQLNPPMNTIIKEGDELIHIAADDDQIHFMAATPVVDVSLIKERAKVSLDPERILILGWNWRGKEIIRELDQYVIKGSEVKVIADNLEVEKELKRFGRDLKHLRIQFEEGDSTDRRTLDALQVGTYKHIILLCYSDTLPPQRADAHTLVTLLHLRDIANKTGKSFSIVSEMNDIRNRNLADVTRADDFIVSDKLISLMLAQVSENKRLNAVFTDIFDPEGSEIYLKPVSQYVQTGKAMNFFTVIEAAARSSETAIGYRIRSEADQPEKNYGIHINPLKDNEIIFTENDKIIVLAEE